MTKYFFQNLGEEIVQLPGGYPLNPGKTLTIDSAEDGRVREIFDHEPNLVSFEESLARIGGAGLLLVAIISRVPTTIGAPAYTLFVSVPADAEGMTFEVPLFPFDEISGALGTLSGEFTVTFGDGDATAIDGVMTAIDGGNGDSVSITFDTDVDGDGRLIGLLANN